MYKTQYNSSHEVWSVVNKHNIICFIPRHYKEDEALAETIAKLLNENNKIVVNLEI